MEGPRRVRPNPQLRSAVVENKEPLIRKKEARFQQLRGLRKAGR